jgi:acylphosphatase
MTTGKQRVDVIVRGYVQGVGYRAFARRQARALGLCGWVRNQADGSVRVLAEGERADLLTFLDALRLGPSDAEVQDVEETWLTYCGDVFTFEVRF